MEKIREFFMREWTVEDKVLFTAAVLLAGVVMGMLLAPFKSINCGNHCGNTYGGDAPENEEE